jgi:cation:H+ antiporter
MWLTVAAVAMVCVPSLVLRFSGTHLDPLLASGVFGLGILGAAFLLSWGAETAEMDMSQGLALAIIAFIAVLPEYAVDAVLAWKAGADPAEAERGLAIANLTGGNRLLIGVGWPVVFAIFAFRSRINILRVGRQRSLELVFLAIATAYVLFIPMRDNLSLMDTIVLVTMFVIYLFLISRVASEEVELVGPARAMGALPDWPRRSVVLMILVFAAGVILSSAEPFADGLVETGEKFGISEFLLIQWLAPLASESPEVLVAGLLAWRGRAAAGMGALISSKVNQWTLLVGTLPIAFAWSSGTWDLGHGLPLDGRQREELFLTAAQSAFAIAVFLDMRMSKREAWMLFGLFGTQLFITNEWFRIIYGIGYLILCAGLLFSRRRQVPRTLRDAWGVARGKLSDVPEEDIEPEPETVARGPAPGELP